MENPEPHTKTFEFFTEHAGQKNPATSQNTWIAFRDALDGANLERFPENEYGSYNDGKNAQRNLNIAQEFSKFGAKQDDPDATYFGLDVVQEQDGINDVMSEVYRGNYSVFMEQNDPRETSQGYWRVGSKDQPYGRFARGFYNQENKNQIYLNIADAFFEGNPHNGASPIKVKIIYFDDGTGSWSLHYDAVGNEDSVALTVNKTNTGRWTDTSVVLDNAYFGNRGPHGSDLSLINTDNKDDIFHMVEIIRNRDK